MPEGPKQTDPTKDRQPSLFSRAEGLLGDWFDPTEFSDYTSSMSEEELKLTLDRFEGDLLRDNDEKRKNNSRRSLWNTLKFRYEDNKQKKEERELQFILDSLDKKLKKIPNNK